MGRQRAYDRQKETDLMGGPGPGPPHAWRREGSHQHWRGSTAPYICTHTASCKMAAGPAAGGRQVHALHAPRPALRQQPAHPLPLPCRRSCCCCRCRQPRHPLPQRGLGPAPAGCSAWSARAAAAAAPRGRWPCCPWWWQRVRRRQYQECSTPPRLPPPTVRPAGHGPGGWQCWGWRHAARRVGRRSRQSGEPGGPALL